jgi:hypothetical protein
MQINSLGYVFSIVLVVAIFSNLSFGVNFTKPVSPTSQGEEWYKDVPFTDLRME